MVQVGYRCALTSMPGRAAEGPRWFDPRHDVHTLPEVELALVVGEALKRNRPSMPKAPPGEPPYQDWYRSLISVPYFDYAAGGIPVAVLQLVSSDVALADGAPPPPMR